MRHGEFRSQAISPLNYVSEKFYPGPRGFLLFFIGKFCDANRFLYIFFLARSAESREKKASGRDRWESHFHAIRF